MEVLEVELVEALEVVEVVEALCPDPAEVRRRLDLTPHSNMETGDTLAPGPGRGHNLSMSRH